MMRAATLWLLPSMLLSACSAETGILLAVTGASVDALEFHVATEAQGRYILDKSASGTRGEVAGRNLSLNPYELLLEPGAGGLSVRVLALGIQHDNAGNETLYSFAFTQTPQRFIDGEVVRRAMSLQTQNANRWARTTGACRRIAISADERYVLYPADDLDCDGHGTATQYPPDCDDDDPEVFPGAFEYCDGKDTNCDGSFAPAQVRCYGLDAETNCLPGNRSCADQSGGGPSGACVLDAQAAAVAQAYCAAYTACQALDPQRCTRTVPVAKYACSLAMKDALLSCEPAGTIDLDPPTSADACQWRVVQSGGFAAALVNRETLASYGDATEDCKPALRVSAESNSPKKGTVVLEFFANGNPGWVSSFEVMQVDDPTCEGEHLTCERQ